MHRSLRRVASAAALLAATAFAHGAGTVGGSLPADFPVIEDASLPGQPLLGFGAAGTVTRTPVIFIHGNNDTPFPIAGCSPYGFMQAFAQFLANNGYSPSELWAIGYEGDQCDLAANPTRRSSIAHTNAANVPDLRRFVRAVLAYTGAKEIDIVAHSLGVTLAREWMRQDEAGRIVRRLVAIDGPNHGIINCAELLPASRARWLHTGERGLPGGRFAAHAVPASPQRRRPAARQPRRQDARDPQRRHELRLLLRAGRPLLRAGASDRLFRNSDRLLEERHSAWREGDRVERAGRLRPGRGDRPRRRPQLAADVAGDARVPEPEGRARQG
jgi:hypothetical protein